MNKYNKILEVLLNLSDQQIDQLLNQISEKENINVENILKELCVNPSLLGFNYLKDAIELCLDNPGMLSGITKLLYPSLAKKHETTSARVERAIRHAIETSWGKIDGDTYHEVFYNEFDKPTNSRYIAYVCSYIKNLKTTRCNQPNQKVFK